MQSRNQERKAGLEDGKALAGKNRFSPATLISGPYAASDLRFSDGTIIDIAISIIVPIGNVRMGICLRLGRPIQTRGQPRCGDLMGRDQPGVGSGFFLKTTSNHLSHRVAVAQGLNEETGNHHRPHRQWRGLAES
jgi:hypothetical protein